MDFSNIVVNGIPLLLLIIGLVEFVRQMGLGGKALRAVSALIGLAFDLLYQISLGMPADFAGWFGAIVFGLGLGITASGLVDVARDLVARAKS